MPCTFNFSVKLKWPSITVFLIFFELLNSFFSQSSSLLACRTSNTITVLEPFRETQWTSETNSHRISWSQSGHSFKWNIELLDSKKSKVLDIRNSLSEFREGEMSFYWLVPSSVASGSYVVRVKDGNSEDCYGVSEQFAIINKADSQSQASFLPGFAYANQLDVTSVLNDTEDRPPLPHEQKHRQKLEREAEHFKSINMADYWTKPTGHCTILRVHQPSSERFEEEFVKRGVPVIITGLTKDWPAMNSWDFQKLGDRLTHGVKVDIMDMATPYSRWNELRLTMAASLREPPQVHMTDFHIVYPELMRDITIPDILENRKDFMELVDADIRPAQLSFQMAAKRSGYHWRVETLNGSLWSVLIQGHKRWGLYPPSTYFPPGVVHNNYRAQDSQDSEPFMWWAYTQPNLRTDRRPLECVQGPGEILYIPSGWWWSHINLVDSISMQRWFCDKFSLRACLDELKDQSDSGVTNYNADIFIQLRHYLAQHYPEILTADDREFESPIKGLGPTITEFEKDYSEAKWQEYFGKYEIGAHFGAFDDENEKDEKAEEEIEWRNTVKGATDRRKSRTSYTDGS